MKNKKLLKVLVSTGGLISLSATTGTILSNFNTNHPNSTIKVPKPNLGKIQKDQQLKNNINANYKVSSTEQGYNNSWAGFQKSIHNETTLNIIKGARLTTWAFQTSDKFSVLHIDSDFDTKTVTLYMDQHIDSNFSRAVFQIKYDGQAYDLSNWTCITLPTAVSAINYSQWNKFISDQHASWTGGIFLSAHPKGWENIDYNNLILSSQFDVNYLDNTVTRYMDYNNNGTWQRASFQIKYTLKDPSVAVWSNWKTIAQPHTIVNNWTDFISNFNHILSPNRLLQIAQPWLKSNQINTYYDHPGYNWTNGNLSQRFWQYNNNANWDTFGAISKTDAYQGMAGKPKVRSLDSGRKEITAIISKKGRNCQFDADPIKGRFDFVPGDQVNYSNWK